MLIKKNFSSTATADRKGGLSMATKKVVKKAPAKKLAAKKPAAKKAAPAKKAPAKKVAAKKKVKIFFDRKLEWRRI